MVTGHRAVKGELIVAWHGSSDGIRSGGSLAEKIEIRAFCHLGEVGGQAFKKRSNLPINFHALIAGRSDRGRADKKAAEEQHQRNQDRNGNKKFSQRKGG